MIVANVFTFIGYAIDMFVGYYYNKKATIILCNIVSSLCSLIAMALLQSIAGCISVIVTILRLCVIYYKDKNGWDIDWVVWIFIMGYTLVFFDHNIWVASLLFLGNLCSFVPKWFCTNVQYLRIGAFIAIVLIILANYLLKIYSSIPFLIVSGIMLIISYIKWYKTERVENTVCKE